jgi:hypothetical protein
VVDGLKRNRHDSKRDDIERMEVNYSLHIFELSMEGSERPEEDNLEQALPVYFTVNTPLEKPAWGAGVDRSADMNDLPQREMYMSYSASEIRQVTISSE